MDDRMLAEQLAKTGNLMDLCSGDAWLQEIEDSEDDGWIEAGVTMKPYGELLKAASPEALKRQRRYMRILSILFPELKRWLASWGLGLTFEAVHIEARRIVRQHLFNRLTPEQDAWMDALVAEDDQHLQMAERKVRSQVVTILSTLFTEEDWRKLAAIAAEGMSKGVLQVAKTKVVSI